MKRKPMNKENMIQSLILLSITIVFTIILLKFFPEKTEIVTTTSWNYFIEMIIILPAVMILMGLLAVFISNEIVVKYLGKTSGIKGIALSIFLGALPTGPLYIAFPMGATLIKKGASISNIIIFLSSWACIKIPQEMVELQFLGINFMTLRLTLTIIFVSIMGVIIEKIIGKTERVVENKVI